MQSREETKNATRLVDFFFILMTIKAEDRRSPNVVVICVRETRQIMIYRLQEDASEDELMTSDGAWSETEVYQQLKTEIH